MNNSNNRKAIALTEKEKELLRAYGEDIDDGEYEIYEITEDESEDYDYKRELRRHEKEEKKKFKEEQRRRIIEEKDNIKNGIKEELKEDITEQIREELDDKDTLENYILSMDNNDINEEPTIEEENSAYFNYNYYNEIEDTVNKSDDNEDYSEEYNGKDEIDEVKVKTKVKNKKKSRNSKINLISNIIFIIILIIIAFITTDIIRVKKYDKLPLFAIPLKIHDDGGTREYYGIGYKVIDYYELQGKKGKEMGTWFMKYNVKPDYTLNGVDLAIEVNTNEEKAFNKYYNKYVKIETTLKSVEKEFNEITTGYNDEDNKYTLDVVCKMSSDKEELTFLETDKPITIVGVVKEFDYETGTNPSTLFLEDCSAEQ